MLHIKAATKINTLNRKKFMNLSRWIVKMMEFVVGLDWNGSRDAQKLIASKIIAINTMK